MLGCYMGLWKEQAMAQIAKSIIPDGRREFRSFREMDAYIESRAEPLMSDEPCGCGAVKQWGHRYCHQCRLKQLKSGRRGS